VIVVAAAALAGAGLLVAGGWVRRNLVVVRITGSSMEPTYAEGDRVLVRRRRDAGVRQGEVVVVRAGKLPGPPPTLRDPFLVIKRVAAVPGDPVPRDRVPSLRDAPEPTVPDGCLVVLGDNPAGGDSRQLGYYFTRNLIGTVVRPRPLSSAAPQGSGPHRRSHRRADVGRAVAAAEPGSPTGPAR